MTIPPAPLSEVSQWLGWYRALVGALLAIIMGMVGYFGAVNLAKLDTLSVQAATFITRMDRAETNIRNLGMQSHDIDIRVVVLEQTTVRKK